MTAQEAFEKTQPLRELPRNTHVQTYRAQRTLLQSLNDTDLAEVSLMLSQSDDALSGNQNERGAR
jgi:hypothetical protein